MPNHAVVERHTSTSTHIGAWSLVLSQPRGVRDMIAVPGGYLLIAGPVADGGPFDLYRWSGRSGDAPRKVTANLAGLSPEGLVALNSRSVLVLSDDGDVDDCKHASPAKQRFRGRVVRL